MKMLKIRIGTIKRCNNNILSLSSFSSLRPSPASSSIIDIEKKDSNSNNIDIKITKEKITTSKPEPLSTTTASTLTPAEFRKLHQVILYLFYNLTFNSILSLLLLN